MINDGNHLLYNLGSCIIPYDDILYKCDNILYKCDNILYKCDNILYNIAYDISI